MSRPGFPRFHVMRGRWEGGDSRTLYAFTDLRTGKTTVCPGRSRFTSGPEADVRIATRAEAELHWSNPVHAGWKVAP